MKKYILIVILILGLLGLGYYSFSTIKDLNQRLGIAKANEKAYVAENDSLKNQNRVFQFTVADYKAGKDSISLKLKIAQKELGIKDKKLVSMQYYIDHFLKTDTIEYTDTVIAPGVDKDTLIGNKFYSLDLHLQYPNKITTKVSFTNEKEVFVSLKRETIDPPYKFFLWRWFQKKQDVAIVDIKDSNPYLVKGQSRFIQVIKK